MIRWKRANDDFVESRDGRWRIVPLYAGCTRPPRSDSSDSRRPHHDRVPMTESRRVLFPVSCFLDPLILGSRSPVSRTRRRRLLAETGYELLRFH